MISTELWHFFWDDCLKFWRWSYQIALSADDMLCEICNPHLENLYQISDPLHPKKADHICKSLCYWIFGYKYGYFDNNSPIWTLYSCKITTTSPKWSYLDLQLSGLQFWPPPILWFAVLNPQFRDFQFWSRPISWFSVLDPQISRFSILDPKFRSFRFWTPVFCGFRFRTPNFTVFGSWTTITTLIQWVTPMWTFSHFVDLFKKWWTYFKNGLFKIVDLWEERLM